MSTATEARTAGGHLPQLDGLRAFAVFAVLIEHYVKIADDPVRAALPWGALGVRLFFVLSGFLITGILFRSRDTLGRGEVTLGRALRTFFARRFIRLMPVYYAYLLAIAVLLPAGRQYLWAFALYLQNFLFAWKPAVFELMLAHFWSLAVEEQFYLTWPFVVLLTPRRWLPATLAGIVLLGPVLRAVAFGLGLTPHQIDMMMPAHFDTLGLGGLLAVLGAGDEREQARRGQLVTIGLWVGLPLTVAACIAAARESWATAVLVSDLGMGLFFCWVVARAAQGFGGVAGRILNGRVPRYLGKISYGIYVYHFNVPGLVRDKVAPRLGLVLPAHHPWAKFTLFAAVTVAVAAASWTLMEQPLNRLKERFAYAPSRRKLAGVTDPEPAPHVAMLK